MEAKKEVVKASECLVSLVPVEVGIRMIGRDFLSDSVVYIIQNL